MTCSHTHRWSAGPLRRFTRNLVLPVNAAGTQLLLKYTRDPAEAREEIQGHHRLRPYYRVPALYAHLRVPGGYLLIYQRLPSGRDQGLLLDLLNAEQQTPALKRYLNDLTSHYRDVILATARRVHPSQLVRKLYWNRATPGGRLDHYYADRDPELSDGSTRLPLSELGRYTLWLNGRALRFDWTTALAHLKQHFRTSEPVWAALTQGDPTDVNLAHPLAWLDLDTGGMNSIAGEFANFLWYTTALGGWLVPTYNPEALADHPATFTRLPANAPVLHHVRIDQGSQTLTADYSLHLAESRRLAAAAYWRDLVLPVAGRLWPRENLGDVLRPYLAMRILAVYNLANLTAADRLILIARLADVMSSKFSPESFFISPEAACQAR